MIWVWFILFIGQTVRVQAQLVATNTIHYTLEDGIPQSMVNTIFQDVAGIIWIGTGNGLAFFNGSQFRSVDPYDPEKSVVGNLLIEQGTQTPNRSFLLKYENIGWKYFDPSERFFLVKPINQFARITGEGPFVYAFEDAQGRTWTKTSGGNVLLLSADKKRTVQINASGLIRTNYVYGVACQPATDKVFLVADNGIYVYNEDLQNFRQIPYTIPAAFFYYRSNYPMIWLDGETLLIGTPGKLLKFNCTTETFDEKLIPSISGKADNNPVRLIVSDRKGGYYFEVNKRVYHQTLKGKTNLIWQSTANPELEVDVRCMLLDNNGLLWIGTNANGIYKINPDAFPLTKQEYTSNFHYDVLTGIGEFDKIPLPDFWSKVKWSYDFRWTYSQSNQLYVAFSKLGEKGVRLLKFDNNKWKALRGIDTMTEMIAGLVTSGDTVFAMHREGGLYTWVNDDSLPVFTHLSPNEILNEPVGLYRYKDYWLTLEMRSGIRVFKKGSPRKIYRISGLDLSLPVKVNRFTCLLPKPGVPGMVYLGSYGNGIIEWNVETGFSGMALRSEDLEGAVLYAMATDDQRRIWLTTSKGIKLFYPVTGQLIDLSGMPGMPAYEFNRFHIFKYPDGSMAFGGMEGWLRMPVNKFQPQSTPVNIAFTGCWVNGEAKRQTSRTNKFIPLNTDSLLRFKYFQNYLRFEFTGTDYRSEGKLEYRYMLEGADKQWNESGNLAAANYANLSPGKYRLLVQARNGGDSWVQQSSGILSFTIIPPVWATGYAYLFYTLLLGSGVIWYLRNRRNKMKLQYELAERTMKARQLQELDGLKTKFIDNITHELRTPLTLIHTPITTIEADPALSTETRSLVGMVKRHSMRLIELVNQMLDLSKIQVGAMQEHRSVGNLEQFVSDAMEAFTRQATHDGKKLDSVIRLRHTLQLFDPEKWGRILYNLLSNALKHTGAKDTITVSLIEAENAVQDKSLKLEVADTGEGIEAEHLPFIFDRFYQARNTPAKEGTGIGLSLVKELVDLMGGNILVESEPGIGTRFTILLPAYLPETKGIDAPSVATQEPHRGAAYQSLNVSHTDMPLVLVVEDNEELRDFITSGLKKNYKVLEAADGKEGLELAKAELPDMIVTDWMMPDFDGLELCEQIKKDPRTRHIAVVLLTAKASVENRLIGLKAGADEYLPKPFVWMELELVLTNQILLKQRIVNHLKQKLLPNVPPVQMPESDNEFLQELYSYLDKHYAEVVEVNKMAEIFHMSRRTLHRKIHALLEISPIELIRQYRLQKACLLLAKGQQVGEVAYAVGFESPSYFSKCFKEQYGFSPGEYAQTIND